MADLTGGQGPARTAVSGARWVTALSGGIVIWFLRLIAVTVLVRPACALGLVQGRLMLLSTTVVASAATAACLHLSLRIRRASSQEAPWWDAVGLSAALINGIALTAILVESVPILFVDPCR